MNDRVLVTCATGKVGRELVSQLIGDGVDVVAATSRPESARDVLGRETPTVRLDFSDPGTIAPAVHDVSRLFLVYPYATSRPDTLEGVRALVDRAVESGVSRVVVMSALGIDEHPNDPMAAMERHALDCGVEAIALRPNWFMQNFSTIYLEAIRDDRRLSVPAGDHRLSFVDTRDIAEVACHALMGRPLPKPIVELTGAEALDHEDVARGLTRVIGREIRYHSPSRADALAAMRADGIDDRLIDFYRWLYDDIHRGRNARITGDIERILGRPPRRFSRYLEQTAKVWRS